MLLILLFKFITLKSWEDLLISCLTWYIKIIIWDLKFEVLYIFFILFTCFTYHSDIFLFHAAKDAVCFALQIMSDIDCIWTQLDEYFDKKIIIITCYLKILINLSVLLLSSILRILINKYRELIWDLIEKKEIMYLILIKNLKNWDRIISWIYILLKWELTIKSKLNRWN